MERYPHYPCFQDERDAGIFAEHHYRLMYQQKPNFPDIDDAALELEYEKVIAKREYDIGHNKSAGKQGKVYINKKTSRYVGVFLKDGSRWVARIHYRGKPIYIRSFNIEIEGAEEMAAKAYDEVAVKLYGENARLNFPCIVQT